MSDPSSRSRYNVRNRPFDPQPFIHRLQELLDKHNETFREAAIKAGMDTESVRRYIRGLVRPSMTGCILLADHFEINPNELLQLADWPPLKVFDIKTASAENLPTEAVDVALAIAKIPNPGERKAVAQAVMTLLEKYFED
jgi:transcriptional regulator with XRE-family HTH domain